MRKAINSTTNKLHNLSKIKVSEFFVVLIFVVNDSRTQICTSAIPCVCLMAKCRMACLVLLKKNLGLLFLAGTVRYKDNHLHCDDDSRNYDDS